MVSDADPSPAPTGRVQELFEDNTRLRSEIAGLQGQLDVLRERLGAQDAADERHRVELESARSEASDALAQLREAQVRVEEWRRRVTEAGERQALAERQREQAEHERAAVITALGRRARKHLDTPEPPAT